MNPSHDGIINLYKPVGPTSTRALYQVRAATGVRTSGHAGTLDPLAEGVLLICLGRATKLVERLMDQPKVYRALARLDVTSASFDRETPHLPVEVAHVPETKAVREACAAFEGERQQIPPATSALKVRGRPAYKLARKGKAPLLAARTVRIYWMHLWRYEWPEIDFEVACGRGTYIRSLVRDLGAALGAGGCLTRLIRRAVGPFEADAGVSLEQIAGLPLTEYLLPLERAREILAAPVRIPPRPS